MRLTLRQLNQIKLYQIATVIWLVLPACSNAKLSMQFVDTPVPTVSVKVQNYCPDLGYTFTDAFIHNASAMLVGEGIEKDTDRDGLPDSFEMTSAYRQQFNINPFSADTNGLGYSDLFLVRINADVSKQQSLRTCTGLTQDADLDNINDCTEFILRTNYQSYDSDGDHIPDELELRYGLNPSDPSDANQDPDGDGLTNLEEIMAGTNPYVSNTQKMTNRSVRYSSEYSPDGTCINLAMTNIPVVDVDNGNQIRLYVSETNGAGIRQLRTAMIIVASGIKNKDIIINGQTEFAVGRQNVIWGQ